MYDYDTSVAFISLDKAQEFFGLDEAVNGVSIRVDKLFLADKVKRRLRRKSGRGITPAPGWSAIETFCRA